MTPETMTVGDLIAWAEERGVNLRGMWIEVLEDSLSYVFSYTAVVIVYRFGMMAREKGNHTYIPLSADQPLLVPWFVRYPYLLDWVLQARWARRQR